MVIQSKGQDGDRHLVASCALAQKPVLETCGLQVAVQVDIRLVRLPVSGPHLHGVFRIGEANSEAVWGGSLDAIQSLPTRTGVRICVFAAAAASR